eukprot:1162719-Prymnesium_polylepis.1
MGQARVEGRLVGRLAAVDGGAARAARRGARGGRRQVLDVLRRLHRLLLERRRVPLPARLGGGARARRTAQPLRSRGRRGWLRAG